MTTNQTIDGVPRELLARILSYTWFPSGDIGVFDLRLIDREQLRALLDAEQDEYVPDGILRAVEYGAQVDAIGILKKAAQPQGEPVALDVWYGPMPETNGKTNWTAILHRKGECWSEGITIDRSEYPDRVRYEADRMLHLIGALEDEPDILAYDPDKHSGYVKAEQPSPVAVVMPERKHHVHQGLSHTDAKADGWNACLNEVTLLNSTRPAHANPPPGTEPSGTHPHNDGLDEMRKPQDDQARRAELLESLAQQIYDSWQTQPGWVPWHRAGPSQKKIEARAMASRVFELALANQVGD